LLAGAVYVEAALGAVSAGAAIVVAGSWVLEGVARWRLDASWLA
jgi:hypothetical protein